MGVLYLIFSSIAVEIFVDVNLCGCTSDSLMLHFMDLVAVRGMLYVIS